MPQGNFKNRKVIKVPTKQKKGPTNKSSLKLKKGKGKGITPKKVNILESKRLNMKLQKEINARIEEETKVLASNESYSMKILKAAKTDGKKKKA